MPGMTLRSKAAVAVERLAGGASRRLGRGSGEVVGGRLALRVAPALLSELAAGRPAVLVSATNGKTTTTRMLAAAVRTLGPVATNAGGANMTAGVASALSRAPGAKRLVLEVDELYLPAVARAVRPSAVALLNLSRDQLDRSNETRMIARTWRALGAELAGTVAVANADDPLVVHAAHGFDSQVWVGAGQVWTSDAMVCPRCAALLSRSRPGEAAHWHCPACGLARPQPTVEVSSLDQLRVDGRAEHLALALPGRCNVANAAAAAAAAGVLGVASAAALRAAEKITGVGGRYTTVALAGSQRQGRLLLAKNPAGWLEMIELVEAEPVRPVIIGFNARTADGRDPSWIWDVPVERLGGRQVLVYGDRRDDISVRLTYAGVEHSAHPDISAAARAAAPTADGELDVLATYTAFRELLDPAAAAA